MRLRCALLIFSASMLTVVACDDSPPKDPSSVNAKDSDGSDDGEEESSESAQDKKQQAASTKTEFTCKGKGEVGKPASPFKMTSLNGAQKMAIEKGKIVLVDFWATWCEPCKKSFPKYQELYVKYKASGLEILAISVDDEKKEIPDFVKTYGAKFPVGWDDGHKIADCFKPENMPTAYVIDKNGVVRFVHKGFRPGEEKELDKEIKSLL